MKKITRILFSLLLIGLTATTLSIVGGVPPIYTAAFLLSAGFALGIAKKYFNINTIMDNSLLYDGMVISDTTYAGEAAADFIVKAITENAMIEGGHVYIKDGIKKKFIIPRWDADYEDFIQDMAATPVSKGTQTVTGQTITPAEYMIYHEFDPHDYEDHWFATQIPGNTLLDTTLPTNAESVLIQEVLKRHGRFVNKIMWTGDTTLTTIYKYFNGFKKKANLSSSTIKVTSPVTLDATNVAAQFLRGFNLIPAALKYDERMKIFVSYNTFDLYCQWQIAQSSKGVDMTQRGMDTFRGLKVVRVPDFPDNYYFIAKGSADPGSNLWAGMNSTDDANELILAKKQANSRLWFIKLEMKLDVQIGWNEETVSYE